MPQFTITLSPQAVTRLARLVDIYNQNTGQNLTIAAWVTLHLKEIAIQEDVAAVLPVLQKQKQDELALALQAERDRLLQTL